LLARDDAAVLKENCFYEVMKSGPINIEQPISKIIHEAALPMKGESRSR
jgi:hypothetical protein